MSRMCLRVFQMESRVSTAKPNWIAVGSSQLLNWKLRFKIQDSGLTARHLETECMSFRVSSKSDRFLDSGNHAGVLLYNRCVDIQSCKNLTKFRGHCSKNKITASVFESQDRGSHHVEVRVNVALRCIGCVVYRSR